MDRSLASADEQSQLQEHVPVKIETNLQDTQSIWSSASQHIPLEQEEHTHVNLSADSTDMFTNGFQSMFQTFNDNSQTHRARSTRSEYETARCSLERRGEATVPTESDEISLADRNNLPVHQARSNQIEHAGYLDLYEGGCDVEDHNMFVDQERNSADEVEMRPVYSRKQAMNLTSTPHVTVSDGDNVPTIKVEDSSHSGATKKKTTNQTAKAPSRIQKKARIPKQTGRGRRRSPEMTNAVSLLHNDIVADALANQSAGERPGFNGARTKTGALAAMFGGLSKEEQSNTRGEKEALKKAASQFNYRGRGSMQVVNDGWRLKGMTTVLEHFQLLSTAWGAAREAGETEPFGGMLADTMGYGKTVQMITIMVENQPKIRAKNKTTLIVVPTSIINQWQTEIEKHTEDGIFDRVRVYKTSTFIDERDPIKALRQCDVILTTYQEVMRNYPKCAPPAHLVTDQAKEDWWIEHYQTNKGPLLSTPFFRVVLDEAQHIKNHESRTSKACRLLTARYRWVLSGTPLSNSMDEMFSYFSFLGVKGAADFDQFKKTYAERTETTDQNLDAILQEVMVRRTGKDRLLGKPLVSLPALDHDTIEISFHPLERTIYDKIEERYMIAIHRIFKSGQVKKAHSYALVMLLRLRQVCAHVFIIANILPGFLDSTELDSLFESFESQASQSSEISERTLMTFQQVVQDAREQWSQKSNLSNLSEDDDIANTLAEDPDMDLDELTSQLQSQNAWGDNRNQDCCFGCSEILNVDSARLAVPCGHLYCETCLSFPLESAQRSNMVFACLECNIPINGVRNMTVLAPQAGKLRQTRDRDSQLDQYEAMRKIKQQNLDWLDLPEAELMSTKIRAIVTTLEQWIANDPEAKIVIFTLFLPVIKILTKISNQRGWGSEEYTGKLNLRARNAAIGRFKDPAKGKKLLLMSMRAGGVGLNLTEASYVIIADPWWNQAAEDQAFSRVYRIGQQRNCVVRRFLVKDAVDTDKILGLQIAKLLECNRVIDGDPQQKATLEDLLRRFESKQKGPQMRFPTSRVDQSDVGYGVDDVETSESQVVVADDTDQVSAPNKWMEA